MVQAQIQFDNDTANDIQQTPYILVSERQDGKKEINVQNLTVKTPGRSALTLVKDVNFTLSEGDRVVLTGASGTGKTTVAKAFLNHWDYGLGTIVMPSGMKVMGMAQKAYFPDVPLRAIMNMEPNDSEEFTYDDKELTKALQQVGLDQLIQHIPGQQVEILMNDLLADIENILKPYAEIQMTGPKFKAIELAILARVVERVSEQFNVVQYTPDEQREYFTEKVAEVVGKTLKQPWPKATTDILTDKIIDTIDIELARPLREQLCESIPDMLHRKRSWFSSYTSSDIDALSHSLHSQLKTRLKKYMSNDDTDDSNREIRINKTQAYYVAKEASERLNAELRNDNISRICKLSNKYAGQNIKKLYNFAAGHYRDVMPEKAQSVISKTFNAASTTAGWSASALTWPFRKIFALAAWAPNRLALSRRTKSLANDLQQMTTYFMDRQIVTGDAFTNSSRLSGGQKQKLMIAIALLHKPDILIPDEITASLDPEAAEQLYSMMMNELPEETIVLSIAHNPHILKYHTHHAHLADQGINITEVAGSKTPAKPMCDDQSPPVPPVPS